MINTEPLDIYCRQELCDEDLQDTVYGTDKEFNTLLYDIDNDYDDDYDNYDIDTYDDTDNEASQIHETNSENINDYVTEYK